MSYLEDLPINEDSLIEELKEQHIKFAQWGNAFSVAQKRTRELKIQLEKLEAELRYQVRLQLIKEGTRPSEGILNEYLNRNPKYIQAKRLVATAEFEEEEAKNARNSMYMRKEILLELCKLLGQETSNTYDRLAKQLERKLKQQ